MQAARRWDVHFHRTGQLKSSKIQTNFKAKDSGSSRRTLPSWRSCNLPHRASEEAAAFPCPLQYLLRWKVGSTCRIFRKFPLFLQSFGSDGYFGSTPKSEARKASPNIHRETHALGSLAANERHRIRWCIQVVSFNHHPTGLEIDA